MKRLDPPSYEEYKDAVRAEFMQYMSNVGTPGELERFLNTEDADEAIFDNYELSLARYNRGETERSRFISGSLRASTYCLSMLYE